MPPAGPWARGRGRLAPWPVLLLAACNAAHRLPSAPEAAPPEPRWIWLRAEAVDGEAGWFKRTFTLPAAPLSAEIEGSGDDHLAIWLNGALVLEDHDWHRPADADVTGALVCGTNELLVRGENDQGPAGLWLRLDVRLPDGAPADHVVSDGSWRALADAAGTPDEIERHDWAPAHVFGPLAVAPWGLEPPAPVADGSAIHVPAGFRAELVYAVPRAQGSWIALARDPEGRLVAAAQEGGLYRVTPRAGAEPEVEDLGVDLGEVQGLAFAQGSLWAMVEGGGEDGSGGLYRLTDTDGDGRFDEVRRVLHIDGQGEHGAHAIVPAADGRTLWLVIGNHTKLPPVDASLVPRVWGEDELGAHLDDPNGHAVGIRPPGGCVLSFAPDTGRCTLFACGLRNSYDLALGPDDELFAYDADMEWDMGLPWYRPPRFLHVVSGADFGWRTGTGKWPEGYPDTLPSIVASGPASPTGLVFGSETRFPAPWRGALFAGDWAYGTIYALHLVPDGASFRGQLERFATAEPLPVTDLVVGADGALWFTTGGRGLSSGLYRVSWEGTPVADDAPLAPDDPDASRARATRKKLEELHASAGGGGFTLAWQGLGASDPFLRHAARVAIEHADPAGWRELAIGEERPRAAVTALLALARVADGDAGDEIVTRLLALRVLDRGSGLRYDALRVVELVLLRQGPLSPGLRQQILGRFEELHPCGDFTTDRELERLLVGLRSPCAVAELLPRLAPERPLPEALHAALLLSAVRDGWDEDSRTTYLAFLDRAEVTIDGGASAKLYVGRMRDTFLAGLDEETRARLAARAEPEAAPAAPPAPELPQPRPAPHAWTTAELGADLPEVSKGRSFALGAAVWNAASCATCHRLAGAGGAVGPDLTGAAGRFSPAELLRTILEPSAEIADQYRETEVWRKDGSVVVGRIVSDDGTRLVVRVPPPHEQLQEIALADVEERRPHPLSAMPEGLLDPFSKEEVLDLLAYVLAGGRADGPSFRAP